MISPAFLPVSPAKESTSFGFMKAKVLQSGRSSSIGDVFMASCYHNTFKANQGPLNLSTARGGCDPTDEESAHARSLTARRGAGLDADCVCHEEDNPRKEE